MGGRSASISDKFGVAVLKASARRSDKFGVVVFKPCMLDWGNRSASTSTRFGVAVVKASMLDWGVYLPSFCSSIESIYV